MSGLPWVVEKWVAVFEEAFEVDAYLDLFTEDVEVRDAGAKRVLRGKEELREFVRPFTALSQLHLTIDSYAVNDSTVFLEMNLEAKAPTGDGMTSQGVVVFSLRDEKIASYATYLFRENLEL